MGREDFLKKEILSSKLRLISKIQPCQKMDCKRLNLMNNSNSTAFWRTLYNLAGFKGHTRHDLYFLIRETTDDAFTLIKKYSKSKNTMDINICLNLMDDILRAQANILTGIKQVYTSDDAFVSQLEQLNDKIQITIESINNSDFETSAMMNSDITHLTRNPTEPMIIHTVNNTGENSHCLGQTPKMRK